MKRIFFFLVLQPFLLVGQTKISITSSCSYYGEKFPEQVYSFASDNDAQTALARITQASGLPTNFKLVAGNVPNACATLKWNSSIQGYDRFIIYNQTFMQRLKNLTNDWAALSILAHEVGHHLSGHSLISGGSRPELELEADKFSGFVLSRLGASLGEAQLAIKSLTTENYSNTHPPKSARLAAIANGWIEGNSKITSSTSNSSSSNTNKKINLSNFSDCSEFVLKKSESGGYWLYNTEYNYYAKNDIDYISLSIGSNIIIYFIEYGGYFIIENYDQLQPNIEKKIKFITSSNGIFIKAPDGFWLFYKGKEAGNVDYITWNANVDGRDGYVVMRSKKTGNTFWVHISNYKYGSYYSPISVYSE